MDVVDRGPRIFITLSSRENRNLASGMTARKHACVPCGCFLITGPQAQVSHPGGTVRIRIFYGARIDRAR